LFLVTFASDLNQAWKAKRTARTQLDGVEEGDEEECYRDEG
jgi:hypothetical protein